MEYETVNAYPYQGKDYPKYDECHSIIIDLRVCRAFRDRDRRCHVPVSLSLSIYRFFEQGGGCCSDWNCFFKQDVRVKPRIQPELR